MAVTVRRGISKRSHQKIGDCEQSKPSSSRSAVKRSTDWANPAAIKTTTNTSNYTKLTTTAPVNYHNYIELRQSMYLLISAEEGKGSRNYKSRENAKIVQVLRLTILGDPVNFHHEQFINPTNCPRVSEDGV